MQSRTENILLNVCTLKFSIFSFSTIEKKIVCHCCNSKSPSTTLYPESNTQFSSEWKEIKFFLIEFRTMINSTMTIKKGIVIKQIPSFDEMSILTFFFRLSLTECPNKITNWCENSWLIIARAKQNRKKLPLINKWWDKYFTYIFFSVEMCLQTLILLNARVFSRSTALHKRSLLFFHWI